MPPVYSVYDAKAKFGEIIRKVRSGHPVLISYRGKEVAEVRPIPKDRMRGIAEALEDLEAEGILGPPAKPAGPPKPLVRKPGALARFLESRE